MGGNTKITGNTEKKQRQSLYDGWFGEFWDVYDVYVYAYYICIIYANVLIREQYTITEISCELYPFLEGNGTNVLLGGNPKHEEKNVAN